jgi:5-methyltetrahydrofolate--homocysteine methyltransferase
MSIDFSPLRWDKVERDYTAWWNDALDRPLVPVVLHGREPGRPAPSVPPFCYETSADLRYSVKEIVDRMDYDLSCREYLGDAFPFWALNEFGPCFLVAFLGCEPHPTKDTVWLAPEKIIPIEDIHFEFNPNHFRVQRILDMYAEAVRRWQGQVQLGISDIGGVMDNLSFFRPGELLLYDLYDSPKEVHRLENELLDIWLQVYKLFCEAVPIQYRHGFADWTGLLSPVPCYTMQSDFSFMLSCDMFDEFVLPRLMRGFSTIPHTTYHMDGVGQLKNLNRILSIPEVDVLQWVPGAGQNPAGEWPEVCKAAISAGKKFQLIDGLDSLEGVCRCLGSGKGVHMYRVEGHISERDEYRRRLFELGVE